MGGKKNRPKTKWRKVSIGNADDSADSQNEETPENNHNSSESEFQNGHLHQTSQGTPSDDGGPFYDQLHHFPHPSYDYEQHVHFVKENGFLPFPAISNSGQLVSESQEEGVGGCYVNGLWIPNSELFKYGIQPPPAQANNTPPSLVYHPNVPWVCLRPLQQGGPGQQVPPQSPTIPTNAQYFLYFTRKPPPWFQHQREGWRRRHHPNHQHQQDNPPHPHHQSSSHPNHPMLHPSPYWNFNHAPHHTLLPSIDWEGGEQQLQSIDRESTPSSDERVNQLPQQVEMTETNHTIHSPYVYPGYSFGQPVFTAPVLPIKQHQSTASSSGVPSTTNSTSTTSKQPEQVLSGSAAGSNNSSPPISNSINTSDRNSETPTTLSESPITLSEIPLTTSESTDISTNKSNIPITSSEAPITSSEKPIILSEKQITSSDLSINSSDLPITSSELPITSSETSITSSEIPITSSEIPITSNKTPITSNETPITYEKLITLHETPIASSESSITSSEISSETPKVPFESPKISSETPTTFKSPKTSETPKTSSVTSIASPKKSKTSTTGTPRTSTEISTSSNSSKETASKTAQKLKKKKKKKNKTKSEMEIVPEDTVVLSQATPVKPDHLDLKKDVDVTNMSQIPNGNVLNNFSREFYQDIERHPSSNNNTSTKANVMAGKPPLKLEMTASRILCPQPVLDYAESLVQMTLVQVHEELRLQANLVGSQKSGKATEDVATCINASIFKESSKTAPSPLCSWLKTLVTVLMRSMVKIIIDHEHPLL